jgi:hypothetical protein
MIIKPAVKRLFFARKSAGDVIVSDCGKSWPVPEGHSPKWFMAAVAEELIEDGYAVIMDQKSLEKAP